MRTLAVPFCILGAALLAGCGSGASAPDAAPEIPAWDKRLPPAAEAMGVRRGLIPTRGIIHLHSVYSHDACDGNPREGDTGPIDTACLADLRAALCATRIDWAALTDHDASMAGEDFETLLLAETAADLIHDDGGHPIAARLRCEDGHQVILTAGGENPLMPIMLDRHVEGSVEERRDLYNAETLEAVAAMRAAGALVWIPHTESRTLETLLALQPDGLEIYNLHANIDPDIRADYLSLPSSGAIQAVAEFADTNLTELEPDLALISFLEPNRPAVAHWDWLLGDGARLAGSAGTDAHQNALPIPMRDGERGDSYRRMLRWFANIALVDDPDDPAAIEAALAAGRFFVAFEVLGTPAGFDVVVTGAGAPIEMGGEVSASAGATLEVTVPSVHALSTALPVPEIRARVIHVIGSGPTEIASTEGPTLSVPLDAPGAYRVEIMIVPNHLRPYLQGLRDDHAGREHTWVYGNPIYVVE